MEESCNANGGFGEKRKACEPISYPDSKRGLCSFPSGGNGFGTTPFAPAQWVELHRQALIYKHFISSVPVPPYLLFPIHYSNTSCYMIDGRGKMVNLGFLFNNDEDLEPRRCRRTDGKKWRCSKDAAPDHKYCERHMHRGKPRSRKPVEPQKTNNSFQNHSNNNIVVTNTAATADERESRVAQRYNNLLNLNLNYDDLKDYSYPILNSDLSSVEEGSHVETRWFIDEWSTQKPVTKPDNNLDSLELLPNPGLSLSMSNDQIALGLADPLSSMQSTVNWTNQGSSLDGPLGEFFQPHNEQTKTVIEDLNARELIDLWNNNCNETHNDEISPHESPINPVVSSPSGILHKVLFSQSDSSNVSSPTFGVLNWH